jgi:hypothetical protein
MNTLCYQAWHKNLSRWMNCAAMNFMRDNCNTHGQGLSTWHFQSSAKNVINIGRNLSRKHDWNDSRTQQNSVGLSKTRFDSAALSMTQHGSASHSMTLSMTRHDTQYLWLSMLRKWTKIFPMGHNFEQSNFFKLGILAILLQRPVYCFALSSRAI